MLYNQHFDPRFFKIRAEAMSKSYRYDWWLKKLVFCRKRKTSWHISFAAKENSFLSQYRTKRNTKLWILKPVTVRNMFYYVKKSEFSDFEVGFHAQSFLRGAEGHFGVQLIEFDRLSPPFLPYFSFPPQYEGVFEKLIQNSERATQKSLRIPFLNTKYLIAHIFICFFITLI